MTTAAGASADVGLIGLAVMGQNLALNLADHGYRVAVYNRTPAAMEKVVAEHQDTPGGLVGTAALLEFVAALKKPRKILILVKAGPPVDSVVEQLNAQVSRRLVEFVLHGIGRDDLGASARPLES